MTDAARGLLQQVFDNKTRAGAEISFVIELDPLSCGSPFIRLHAMLFSWSS